MQEGACDLFLQQATGVSQQSTAMSHSDSTVTLRHIPKYLPLPQVCGGERWLTGIAVAISENLPYITGSSESRGGSLKHSRNWEPQKEFMTTVKMHECILFAVENLKKKPRWVFPEVADLLLYTPTGCWTSSAENLNCIASVTNTNPNLVATCRTVPFILCTENTNPQTPRSSSASG